MNSPVETPEIPILMAYKSEFGMDKSSQDLVRTLLKRGNPRLMPTMISETLFNIVTAVGKEEKPKYSAIIVGTGCFEQTGVAGNIPSKDHPLSAYADIINFPMRPMVSGRSPQESDMWECRRAEIDRLRADIYKGCPGAVLFWFREAHGREWQEKTRVIEPVLEIFPPVSDEKKYDSNTYGTEWVRTITETLSAN